MGGIEGIEKVFGDRALDKATATIVEVDGYERQASNPAVVQETASCGSLKDAVMAKHVQQYDKAHPTVVVIAPQHDRGSNACKEPDGKAGVAYVKDIL